jgi:serine/threonine-protein kinase
MSHDSTSDLATSDFVTVPQNSEESRAFLQARVSLFGKMLALMSAGFLFVSASSYFILAPSPSIATRLSRDRYDLLSIALLTALWAVARRGTLSKGTLEVLEAGAAIFSCAGYAVMVAGADEEFNILVPSLCALAVLMARAVFVPTTPRRTFVVSLVGAFPSVVVTAFLATRLHAQTSIPTAIGKFSYGPIVYVACWTGLTVALATITSRVIYGLEQRVREARQLGQYTLAERIGGGGMGVVYRAHHAMLRRPTAVKVLPPDKMGPENVGRFEREVQLTSQLTHPNTVAIYDFGRTPEGLFYYAMEYLDGFTLTELVEGVGPLPARRVAWLMRQIAGSISEAHRVGLIHRDIKPDNVIVCDRGGFCDLVKVLDFGLVKEVRSSDPALSHVEAIVGTPLYMSPEAITSPSAVDEASDIYALGAVAYYLVAGRHVFSAKTLVEVCAHHLSTLPESPSTRLDEPLPADMERLILDCLAKDPKRRPGSADALERAYVDILEPNRWTQDEARAWWSAHRDDLTRQRASRPKAGPTPERHIVRNTAHAGIQR